MFGQSKPASFSGFGTTTSTFGGFGQSSGFGTSSAFGSQTPAGGSLFGGGGTGSTGTTGGGLFGQQSTSAFGQTQNTGFSFGGQSGSTGGGLFGASSQANPSSGSLFATPASGSGFGAKPSGFSGFGSTASTTGGTGGGLFGATTGSTPSLFGSGQVGTSAFGVSSVAGGAGGTTVAFNPPSGTDTMMKDRIATNINTRHQCITAMKEYEAKSLEELRFEDYGSNRKSKQAGGTTSGGLFGQGSSTQTSTGGFAFGTGLGSGGLASSSTGFGGFGGSSSAATTPFNQSRPLFGTTTTTQSGFGFGAATGTQQSSSLFGSTARPLFGGSTSTQPSFGAISYSDKLGAGAANPVGFGTTGATSGGLFGAAKPSGFGAPTTSSIGFGTGGSLFGQTSTASTFGFGTNTSTTGGFGAGTSGGSMFSMKPGGLTNPQTGWNTLGKPGLGTGATTNPFGQTAAKPSFGGFSFGGGTNTGTTGFGSTLTNNAGAGNFSLGGLGSNTLGTATISSQANSTQHLLALASSPYGDNPLFWNLKQQSKERRDDALKPTNPNAQKAALASANQYKVSPRPTTKIKPKSLHNLVNGGKAQLFEGLEDEDFSFGDDTFVPRKSVKKLVLRKGLGNRSTPGSSSVYSDAGADLSQPINQSSNNVASSPSDVLPITRPLNNSQLDNTIENEAEAVVHIQSTPRSTGGNQNPNLDGSYTAPNQHTGIENANPETPQNNRLTAADTTTSFLDSSDLDSSCLPVDRSTPHPTGIILTRPGYYTIPALDDMIGLMDEDGNCFVEDFTVGRDNFGNVFFPGVTNVAGMNLDDIVHFRRKEIVIYPDDDRKPPLGDGLNKKAEVTLDCVWPTDKSSKTPVKSPERLKLMNYAEKIELITARIGAKFIDYRPETGSWVFQVNHFSKYGLLDDSDDESSGMDPLAMSTQQARDIQLVQKLKVQQEQQIAKQKEAEKAGLVAQMFSPELDEEDGQTIPKHSEEQAMEGDDDFILDVERNLARPGARIKSFKSEFGEEDDEMEESMDSKFLASSMGVSAQNIQGMKASFFGDGLEAIARKKERQMMLEDMDDYEEDLRSLWNKSGKLFGAFKHPGKLSLPQSPAFSDRSDKEGYEPSAFGKGGLLAPPASLRPVPQTFLHPPVMEHKLLPSGLTQSDLPQPIKGSASRIALAPPRYSESLLHHNQEPFVDAACFKGRSFRVGWGPGWTLAHSGALIGFNEDLPQKVSLLPSMGRRVKAPARLKGWQTHIEQIQVSDYMDQTNIPICKQQEELMETQLKHARVCVEDGCPRFVVEPGVDALHELAHCIRVGLTIMESHPDLASQKQMDSVLSLCVSLWGNLPQAEDLDKDDVYRERQLRREAFTQWLAETSASKVAAEMEACPVIGADACLQAVYSKLTVCHISEACMLAQKAKDFRLALLIAQAVGGPVTRQMLAQQLEAWAEQGAIEFISELRQKIYCLLAGQLVWCSREKEINTCQGLDWKRSLALHLWYKCPANASVQHSVRQYQQGFQGTEQSEAYCRPPIPPYLEEATDLTADIDENQRKEGVFDTAYHLLCLYTDRCHGLEALLNPTSSTPAHLDFRLSWHLLQILQAIGYSHLSPGNTDSLHESFASQLESLGLWHWAVFPLLHLSSGPQRRAAVVALLQRHLLVGEELSERELFLVDKLHVPAEWLHHAKAIRAHSEGDSEAEARHLILAGLYNEGHVVVVKHIAAPAIINDDDDYLKRFLDELSPPHRSIGILNWNCNGKVFLDFINLRKQLDQLKKGQPTTSDLEQLEPTVNSLGGRIKGLTCLNAQDRLCQAEMSKTAARLIRTFCELCGDSPTNQLTNLIPDLPMPEDYTQQELQAITHARLMEIA